MKAKLICIFLITICSCNAQKNQRANNPKKVTMEKFDKATFEKNKVNGEYIFTIANTHTVRQMELLKRQEYMEEIKEIKTPYSKVNVYFMNSCNLKVAGARFYHMPIGTWIYYDDNGKIDKETNWDKPFKFTLNDLVEKMKAMKVDILNEANSKDVQRTNDDNTPLYIVLYPVGPEKPYQMYTLTIDGNTGEEISRTTGSIKH